MKSRLNEYLDFYKITQKELSDCTGINRNTIGRYCNNTFESLSKLHLDLLCSFFKCTFDDLFISEWTTPVKYPSTIVQYTILSMPFKNNNNNIKPYHDYNAHIDNLDAFINLKRNNVSQPDIQIMDSNGNISLYEIKSSKSSNKPHIISSHQVLENAKQFKQQNGYNPTPTEEEYHDMQLQQDRLDMECDIETNLELIINNILSNADLSLLPLKIQTEIEAYQQINNMTISFKFILVYRSLYVVAVKQMYNKQLIDFLQQIRRIYNNGGLLELNNMDLMNLANESTNILSIFSIKQKD